jgi:putative flippase GtrA
LPFIINFTNHLPLLWQLLRYASVGVVGLGVDVGLFMLTRHMGLDIVSCNVLARLAGAFTTYTGNFLWTFGEQPRSRFLGETSIRYAVLWVGATVVSTLTLSYLIQLGLSEPLVKVGVELSMPLFNFVVSKRWVFKSPPL